MRWRNEKKINKKEKSKLTRDKNKLREIYSIHTPSERIVLSSINKRMYAITTLFAEQSFSNSCYSRGDTVSIVEGQKITMRRFYEYFDIYINDEVTSLKKKKTWGKEISPNAIHVYVVE